MVCDACKKDDWAKQHMAVHPQWYAQQVLALDPTLVMLLGTLAVSMDLQRRMSGYVGTVCTRSAIDGPLVRSGTPGGWRCCAVDHLTGGRTVYQQCREHREPPPPPATYRLLPDAVAAARCQQWTAAWSVGCSPTASKRQRRTSIPPTFYHQPSCNCLNIAIADTSFSRATAYSSHKFKKFSYSVRRVASL